MSNLRAPANRTDSPEKPCTTAGRSGPLSPGRRSRARLIWCFSRHAGNAALRDCLLLRPPWGWPWWRISASRTCRLSTITPMQGLAGQATKETPTRAAPAPAGPKPALPARSMVRAWKTTPASWGDAGSKTADASLENTAILARPTPTVLVDSVSWLLAVLAAKVRSERAGSTRLTFRAGTTTRYVSADRAAASVTSGSMVPPAISIETATRRIAWTALADSSPQAPLASPAMQCASRRTATLPRRLAFVATRTVRVSLIQIA